MSISGEKDSNDWYDLLLTLSIGIAIIVIGLLIASDRLYFSITYGDIDFGKYHFFIGIGIIASGICYLFLALKGYLEES